MRLSRFCFVPFFLLNLMACKTLEKAQTSALKFAKAAQDVPELAPYFLAAQAQAEFDNKNHQQAKTLAQNLLASPFKLPKIVSLRLKKIMADLAVISGDEQAIIATHQELITLGAETEATLANLAQAFLKAEQHKKAQDIFNRLMIKFPASKEAQQAHQHLDLLAISQNPKDLEKRFDTLIENMAFVSVVEDVDFLLKHGSLSPSQQSDIAALAVKALVYDNQFSKALERSTQRAKLTTASPKDMETVAFVLAKVGRAQEAADYYQRMIALSDDAENKAKACFFRGFSLYEASLYTDALVAWQSCDAAIKRSSYQENYVWYQALSLILLGMHNQAHSLLTDLRQQHVTSPELEKYAYFSAYCLDQQNKGLEGRQEFLKLANKKEPTYYVQRARQKMSFKNHHNEALGATALSKRMAHIHHHDARLAKVLFDAGLSDEARDLIMRGSMTSLDKMSAAQALGFYDAAFRLGRPAVTLENGFLQASEQARAAYPYPYADIMADVSSRYGQNPHLLYAIMRTESSFNKTALSPRGALGLMQIMPHVASELLPQSPLYSQGSTKLSDPHVSLELGALLMSVLKRQFDADHLAIASYNAGAHIVASWQDLFGHLPIELFIERIPYKQTRDYVKKVAQIESVYHGLSGQRLRLLF